jgi:glycosyltransferase involved in cell wall biosynthesis
MVGKLPKDMVMIYLAAADAFVLNTGYEGLSHQLLEALEVQNLPVVTTYRTGNRELIDRKEFKIVAIEYNDVDSIASALIQAARSRQQKRRFVRKRLSNITDEFSEARMVARVAVMCKKVFMSTQS